MKLLRTLAVAPALLAVSCVHEVARAPHAKPVRAARAQTVAPSAFDRQVRNALDAGDGDLRIRRLREKLAAEPDDVTARLDLARAYGESGYPDLELEHCRLAAARFPESGPAQLGLARALRHTGMREDAIRGLEEFLKQHPQTSPEYLSWLGILRDEAGQAGPAEAAHRGALQLDAKRDYLHNNLGYNLLMQKKYEEAAGEFREALKLNPGSQLARNNLGTALAHSDAKQAVENWQAGSGAAGAHNNMAAVLIEQGKYGDARKELGIALGYNKAHPAALKNLELVSRLEGAPATLAGRQPQTRWERWKLSIKRLFVGPLDDGRTEAVKSASAQ
jgi:Flp pilus assembly protein TadD